VPLAKKIDTLPNMALKYERITVKYHSSRSFNESLHFFHAALAVIDIYEELSK
jgi:hypothetical protein